MKSLLAKQNKGSSMITVLVVVTVLMTIVLSVLQVSYRYFIMENGDVYRQKAREAVQSLSEEMKKELTKNFSSYYEPQQGAPEGESAPIWYFIRYNLGREGSNWKFYDPDDTDRIHYNGDKDKFSLYDIKSFKNSAQSGTEKVFTMEAKEAEPSGDIGMVKEELPYITVTLTWMPGKYDDNLLGTKLYVKTECKMGDYTYHVTDRYRLETGEYDKVSETDSLYETVEVKENVYIYKYHRWIWVYEGKN